MFNLTVDEAHTFYVGTNGWLVHNCGDKAVFDALADGDRHTINNVLDLAGQYLGKNQVTIADGIYRSAAPLGKVGGQDVYGMVRITDADIAGHGFDPHANFEIVKKIVYPNGKVTWKTVMDGNKYIFFTDK